MLVSPGGGSVPSRASSWARRPWPHWDGSGAARPGGPRRRPASGAGRRWGNASGRPGRPARRSDSGPASCGGLAADPVAFGDLDHREPVAQHFHDGVEALLCHCELREHAPDLLTSPLVGEAEEGRAVMSTINRNSGTHQPESTRQASTGRAQRPDRGPCQKLARNDASLCHTKQRVASVHRSR